jgi:hypothetical protein
VDALNTAEALAQRHGIAPDHIDKIRAGQDALVAVYDRQLQSWTLRGTEIAALSEALLIWRVQLDFCSRGELAAARAYVEQGHYGHASRKPTWLISCGMQRSELPELNWTKGEQRLPEWMVERYGYAKARRIGVVAMVGGKDKTRIRNATPLPFRDVLLGIARTVNPMQAAA